MDQVAGTTMEKKKKKPSKYDLARDSRAVNGTLQRFALNRAYRHPYAQPRGCWTSLEHC